VAVVTATATATGIIRCNHNKARAPLRKHSDNTFILFLIIAAFFCPAAPESHASMAASTSAAPTPAAPEPHKTIAHASHQHHTAGVHDPTSRPSTPPDAAAVIAGVIVVVQRHVKLCLDPNELVRKGRFGDKHIFERMLEEQVGFADAQLLRGLCAAFSPHNTGPHDARGRVLFRRGRQRRGQGHVGAQAQGATNVKCTSPAASCSMRMGARHGGHTVQS